MFKHWPRITILSFFISFIVLSIYFMWVRFPLLYEIIVLIVLGLAYLAIGFLNVEVDEEDEDNE